MSNDDTQTEDEENPNEGNLAHLREQASAGKAARAEADALKRELMFVKAGIDTTSKVGSLLYKTWEGDDLDALKTEAAELGITSATTTPAGPTPQEMEQQNYRRGLAGNAAAAVEPPTEDPYEASVAGFHKALENGTAEERARFDAFGKIFQAGVNGDSRVFFDQVAYRQQAEDEAFLG